MKNLLVLLLLLLSNLIIYAQVPSSFFEEKDAFKTFSTLQSMQSKDGFVKLMPLVNVEKLLKED